MDRPAKRIIIEYEDRNRGEIKKGICLELSGEEDGGQNMTANMIDFAAGDLVIAAVGFVDLICRLGLSDDMDRYLGIGSKG